MNNIRTIPNLILFIIFMSLPLEGLSLNIDDYLIMQDINDYKFMGKGGGKGSGIVAATGHFSEDHRDESYGAIYFNEIIEIGVKVEVTQHEGGDSDKWLLHELERDFRNYFGLPGNSYVMRQINGNTIMAVGSGGWAYRWLSGIIIVHIEYADLQMTRPEPLEVVEAYLTKQPSTLIPMTSSDLRTNDNKTVWIKDEMERRLWLCDKWFEQFDLGKIELDKTLQAVVNDHLDVFLDYKDKYYGISALQEKRTLFGYLSTRNEAEIRKKIEEYKQWWTENKVNPIDLP